MRGVDLRALVVDWDRLYRMNQAKRASRLQRMRYWVNRLAGWTMMEQHPLMERPDTHVIGYPAEHRIILSGNNAFTVDDCCPHRGKHTPVLHAAHEYRVLARGASPPLIPPVGNRA